MASPIAPETTQVNNSDGHDEDEAQAPRVEPADLQTEKKNIKAERNRMLECHSEAVEERKDEIFTVNYAPNNYMGDAQPPPPASRTEPRTRNREIIMTKIQEPASPKVAPSNNVAALSFRKKERKQDEPGRAPLGDGLSWILERADSADPPLSPPRVPPMVRRADSADPPLSPPRVPPLVRPRMFVKEKDRERERDTEVEDLEVDMDAGEENSENPRNDL